jgi:Gram-negative bacterial TonB protein C-terminal
MDGPHWLTRPRVIAFGSLLLVLCLLLAQAGPAKAKRPPQFTAPDALTVTDIPYPVTTVDAGVLTLAVNLSSSGQILNVQTLRDLPSVTSSTILAVQGWTYKPAVLNGKNVASTLIVDVVFDPAFLMTNGIPLSAPSSFEPPSPRAASFSPAQIFGANFPLYPAKGVGQGAVVLSVAVNAMGSISQVRTLRDLPSLTSAAIAAVKTWTFSQASYDNTSVTSNVVIAMVFRSPSAALP